MPEHWENHLGDALAASLLAGDAIMEVYRSDFAVDYKDDRSPLTEADRRAHGILSARLGGRLPLMSEEGRNAPYDERKDWELYWLVDPLDGTKEFVKRSDEFTVNVALIQRGRPVLGVVYLPAKRDLYFGAAAIGARHIGGADLGGVRGEIGAEPHAAIAAALDRSVRLPLGNSEDRRAMKIVQSSSHASREESEFLSGLQEYCGEIEITPAGSSLKFCRIAEGSADLYPRFGPTMEWDTAAGHCVAEQGGAEVVDIREGSPLGYNKVSLRNGPFVAIGSRFRTGIGDREAVLRLAAALDTGPRTPIR